MISVVVFGPSHAKVRHDRRAQFTTVPPRRAAEALVSLEQATIRERQTRLETEFLLESLRELGFSDRAEEVYQSLTILRESVNFSRPSFCARPLVVSRSRLSRAPRV